jgi:hypothetical protein
MPAVSITATVQQGKIVLPANVDWPSGTVVRIEPVGVQPPTLWETLKDFDGIANDLPPTSRPIWTTTFTVMRAHDRRLCRCLLFCGAAHWA